MQAGAFSQRQDGLVVVVQVAARWMVEEQGHQVASVDGAQNVELGSDKEDAHSVVLQGHQRRAGSSTKVPLPPSEKAHMGEKYKKP